MDTLYRCRAFVGFMAKYLLFRTIETFNFLCGACYESTVRPCVFQAESRYYGVKVYFKVESKKKFYRDEKLKKKY
jgi:hypothetical protein